MSEQNNNENNADMISDKELADMMRKFSRRQRKLYHSRLDKTGVYNSQCRLLMILVNNPDISQKELASRLSISPSAVTVSIKKLEKDGYLKRNTDKADNRCNNVYLTHEGKAIVAKGEKIIAAAEAEVYDGFSHDERIVLADMLNRLNQNITKAENSKGGQ